MSFLSKGKEIERNFAETIGGNVEFSSEDQDMNDHYDVIAGYFKYDVKGLKKIRRSDVYFNEFYHFIEIKNVRGKLGWLYGKADYFAFEINQYWVIVSKEKLQIFVKENISKYYVSSSDESLYCLYQRENRKDIITMVKTIDLMLIAERVLPKLEKHMLKHDVGDSVIEEVRIKNRISRLK